MFQVLATVLARWLARSDQREADLLEAARCFYDRLLNWRFQGRWCTRWRVTLLNDWFWLSLVAGGDGWKGGQGGEDVNRGGPRWAGRSPQSQQHQCSNGFIVITHTGVSGQGMEPARDRGKSKGGQHHRWILIWKDLAKKSVFALIWLQVGNTFIFVKKN